MLAWCHGYQFMKDPRGFVDAVFFLESGIHMWVCLKMLCTPKPNGFADHYPYEKLLFHWEYTLFSDKPMYVYYLYIYNIDRSQ